MRKIVLALLLSAVATFVQADQQFIPLDLAAEKIRDGEIDVGKKITMEFDGRFHRIHTEALGMACTACHAATAYPADFLSVSKDKFPRRGHPGATPRSLCIGCHQQNSVGTPWYNAVAK